LKEIVKQTETAMPTHLRKVMGLGFPNYLETVKQMVMQMPIQNCLETVKQMVKLIEIQNCLVM